MEGEVLAPREALAGGLRAPHCAHAQVGRGAVAELRRHQRALEAVKLLPHHLSLMGREAHQARGLAQVVAHHVVALRDQAHWLAHARRRDRDVADRAELIGAVARRLVGQRQDAGAGVSRGAITPLPRSASYSVRASPVLQLGHPRVELGALWRASRPCRLAGAGFSRVWARAAEVARDRAVGVLLWCWTLNSSGSGLFL